MASKEETDAVFRALENESYEWRTIDGISKETSLPVEVVLKVIEGNRDKIISSSSLSPEGKRLFSSRAHYQKKATTAQKFMSAIKNRLDI